MPVPSAVIVHGLADARTALVEGLPVTLLSAPGVAIFAGCLWWRAMMTAVQTDFSKQDVTDILDCANASGAAMAALRCGVTRLVLWADAPGWAAVASIARQMGGFVLPTAPIALDLADGNAIRRLPDWLTGSAAEHRDIVAWPE